MTIITNVNVSLRLLKTAVTALKDKYIMLTLLLPHILHVIYLLYAPVVYAY